MAANNKKENGKSANVFLIAGIALVVFVAYSMFLGYRLYTQLTGTYNNIQRSLVDVSTIKDNLLMVNRDVLLIIADPNSNAVDNVHEITNCFNDIDRCPFRNRFLFFCINRTGRIDCHHTNSCQGDSAYCSIGFCLFYHSMSFDLSNFCIFHFLSPSFFLSKLWFNLSTGVLQSEKRYMY